MSKKAVVYWVSQITGWGLFILGNIVTAVISEKDLSHTYKVSIIFFIMGIGITHSFRWLIHQWGWKKIEILALVPRVLMASFVMSFIFVLFNTALTDVFNGEFPLMDSILRQTFVMNIINFSVLFFIWSVLYFAVSIFQNWKNEEIQNLELRAAKTEIELNSFRSQMNPHFMFNSLNSIRALVDEDPSKAKEAINMLSGMMRHNLMLGKNQLVTLREELDLVYKYTSIEKIRFEERLNLSVYVEDALHAQMIPPFMLQTIVENGIKHGISKEVKGGFLELKVISDHDNVLIMVRNTGKLRVNNTPEGTGIANTKKRLDLLYKGKASFSIREENNTVITSLIIPKIISNENTNR